MSDPKVTEFIKHMETQVLMDNIDPENLSIIATNAMQMAAQNNETHGTGKKKSRDTYFLALLMLHQLEQEAAQLRLDIAALNEELDEIRQQQSEIADLLNDIDDLIGEGGIYDRASAMDLLEQITGKRPDESMSDADIQALLKHEEAQLRAQQNDLEDRANIVEGKIAEKEHRLDEIEHHTQNLKDTINDPSTSVEELELRTKELEKFGLAEQTTDNTYSQVHEAGQEIEKSLDGTERSHQADLKALM